MSDTPYRYPVRLNAAADIVREIERFVESRGSAPEQWYVGICADARARLFGAHQVLPETGDWIHRVTPSDDVARAVELRLRAAGMDGSTSTDDDPCGMAVYCYRKTRNTRP